MLNEGPQIGDPGGTLLNNTHRLATALRQHQLKQQGVWDLLHALTGGSELSNLKEHSGPNLSTAPNSYHELISILTETFGLLDFSLKAVERFTIELSSSTAPSLSGNHNSPPIWFAQFEKAQAQAFDSLRKELNDRMSDQELSFNRLRQSASAQNSPQSNSSAWKVPLQPNLMNRNTSGQSPRTQPSQPSSEIVLFPGPRDGIGRLSFSPEQISSIQLTCEQQKIRFRVNANAPSKIPFLSKPGMKTDELFRLTKTLFPEFYPEISTNKWSRVFIHKSDTDQNEGLHERGNKIEISDWLVKELIKANHYSSDLCNPLNIKILSTSLSKSRGLSGHYYFCISLLAHPSLHNILMSSPALLGGREIKIQTDTLISKCFACSKLGHNNPNCLNAAFCPFCGEAHTLQDCLLFSPTKSLDSNSSDARESGHELSCALCKEHNHAHNHSGLERGKCETCKTPRFRKFQLADSNIPDYHFQNYFRIARPPPNKYSSRLQMAMKLSKGL